MFILDKVVERYPVALHGVSLGIGNTDPLNREHLRKLKELAARTRAHWVSDHLCWTGILGRNTHDLLPLPYTEEAIAHVVFDQTASGMTQRVVDDYRQVIKGRTEERESTKIATQ